MKKLALSAILGASLMITSSAFALTSMSDSNMKAATGQAGVSIAIDNVKIESYTGSTSYTDTDGSAGVAADAASIVISDKHTIKNYLAMTSAADYVTDFNAASGTTLGAAANWVKAAALSIDVGSCTVLEAGNDNNGQVALTNLAAAVAGGGMTQTAAEAAVVAAGMAPNTATATALLANPALFLTDVAGVVIGLPTLLISTTADTYTVGVAKTGAANNGDAYIQISKGASVMAILGGTIEIAAH
ncbi:MAG: DUF6160 family protein [Desulfobacteraceae bacterium]|jgi:hypothetical protein